MVFETHHLDHVMANKVLVPEYEDYPKYILFLVTYIAYLKITISFYLISNV